MEFSMSRTRSYKPLTGDTSSVNSVSKHGARMNSERPILDSRPEWFNRILLLLIAIIGCCPYGFALAVEGDKPVDFLRDIQPILAQNCWKCHGADEKSRQAELRLDRREAAVESMAIVPGDISQSELAVRIIERDESKRMPPPKSKKTLSERERQLLLRWIEQGAPYAKHWAFNPIVRPAVPTLESTPGTESRPTASRGNVIDAFVRTQLARQVWTQASQANPTTLLRRVSLDLTGLPPTDAELETFLADRPEIAYENAVDRLLASRHYAERMAMDWLDAARYADTNGYNNDEDRTMWPWRDWVIDAFHSNLPYDQFIIEQIAGDLLPNPTASQRLATAFHRNLGHNTEGGIIPEEYRVEYVADRVHTTATIFLGLSLQCARCHDHKYDPITQREYYQFYAFFNQMEEKQASYSKFRAAEPMMTLPSRAEQMELDFLDKRIEQCRAALARSESDSAESLDEWVSRHSTAELRQRVGTGLIHSIAFDSRAASGVVDALHKEVHGTLKDGARVAAGKAGLAIELDGKASVEFENVAGLDGSRAFSIAAWLYPRTSETMAIVSRMDEFNKLRGFDLSLDSEKIAVRLIDQWPDKALKVVSKSKVKTDSWQQVVMVYDGSRSAKGLRLYLDGQPLELDIAADKLIDSIATDKPFRIGRCETSTGFKGMVDELQIYDYSLSAREANILAKGSSIDNALALLDIPKGQRTAQQQSTLNSIFLERIDSFYPKLAVLLAEAQREKQDLESKLTAVMVMRDMPNPRVTFMLVRGQYDQPGEKVTAGIPSALPTLEEGLPRNRLGLARWLVARENPLTARVAVNRWWQMLFGAGLVKTAEDFGVTGEPPSHPELLDYLAAELMESRWNVKALLKLMVMSATYRQDSRITPDDLRRDPENRWLARGARFRLPAESMRDNALAIAGLLNGRIGGPSVKPYQPAGLWEDVTVERRGKYVLDSGLDLYRRSLYTFWKRTCPPPAMMSFDAPNREVCLARRARTNTPLQSLVLLNDPTYVEASRKLAERMLLDGGQEDKQRLAIGYRRCVARVPTEGETEIAGKVLAQARHSFANNPQSVEQLLRVGESTVNDRVDRSELASWTIVASLLLNLDETITKR